MHDRIIIKMIVTATTDKLPIIIPAICLPVKPIRQVNINYQCRL